MRDRSSGGGGFGIKKRYYRPVFMEPLYSGLPKSQERMSIRKMRTFDGEELQPPRDFAVGGSSISTVVAQRRRELLGSHSDISFSECLFMMITVCGLLMVFLFAVSPWGVPPPRRV
jgi:hypothetical protein